MYYKQVTFVNRTGLHARPASEFAAEAAKYQSRIQIQKVGEDKKYNAKSMVKVLLACLTQNDESVIYAEGSDEKEAVEALAGLVAGFTE